MVSGEKSVVNLIKDPLYMYKWVPFGAFKILHLWFLTVWLWCVSVCVSLSLSYLEFVERLGCVDSNLLSASDLFLLLYIQIFVLSPLPPLFLGLLCVYGSLVLSHKSLSLRSLIFFFLLFFFLLLSLDNSIWTLFKFTAASLCSRLWLNPSSEFFCFSYTFGSKLAFGSFY